MKFSVFSLGCRVNTYEGQAIVEKLIENGYEATDELVSADYYVLNTCSVTAEADKKSRQAVARAKKLNPNAKIFICGCSSQNNAKRFEEKDGVIFISGVSKKSEFVDKILRFIKTGENEVKTDVCDLPTVYEDSYVARLTTARAFVKIQDGCNNFCSYCIIPYLRGRSRSRSIESIKKEIELFVGKTKEVVLTGINVSAYGRDIGTSLKCLILALKDVPLRKRFGSLECMVIDEELLSCMKESGFCPSFHLSMQSGCDKTLADMNRKYTSEKFLQIVALIRKYFPDAGITTDVIAGFPQESNEDFEKTYETCKRAKFMHMHVFPYSEREGTRASKMIQVPKQLRVERADKLIKLSNEMNLEFLKSQKGKIYTVFIEESAGEYNVGYTDNFIKVYTKAKIGSFDRHEINEPYLDGVIGGKL